MSKKVAGIYLDDLFVHYTNRSHLHEWVRWVSVGLAIVPVINSLSTQLEVSEQ